MNELQLLALVAGVSALAGLNLYLTVFATGLAVRFSWITLPEPVQALDILGHPAVLAAAGAMVLVEFIADKVPWVDSVWDAIHTLIRPLGAAWLSAGLASQSDPALTVIAALIGGGVALTTHTGKAGVRLAANTSPEPLSNSVLSLLEDAIVLAGLWFIAVYPWVAAGIALAFILVALWVIPWIWRFFAMHLQLLGESLFGPGSAAPPANALPLHWRERLERELQPGEALLQTLPAFALSGRGIPTFARGAVVQVGERVGWIDSRRALLLHATDLETHLHPRLWLDEVSWFSPREKCGLRVRVRKGSGSQLRHWTASTEPSARITG
jgi:hypothetical protein